MTYAQKSNFTVQVGFGIADERRDAGARDGLRKARQQHWRPGILADAGLEDCLTGAADSD